tara:strand:- start:1354 stop:1638 length:285 start_codon:yes stop_codon:yes gene_type:complete
MMSDQINQINQKDAIQDQEIALLKHRIDDTEELAEELRLRVRKLEKWVWGAGAVISAAITIIGLAMAADAKEMNYGSNDTTKQEVLLQFSSSRD